MSDYAKIAFIFLTPFMIAGVLFYLAKGSRRRQLFIVWPIVLAVNVWLGFGQGWPARDFVQLGMLLICWILTGFMVFQNTAKN